MYVGLLAGLALLVLDALVVLVAALADHPVPEAELAGGGVAGLTWFLAALLVAPAVVGGLFWLVAGTTLGGTAVDMLGVHQRPVLPWRANRRFGPWRRVVEVRIERQGGRLVVIVYLDTGVAIRLAAPYDGVLLGRDPSFEAKYFQLRNLWETHRTWQSS